MDSLSPAVSTTVDIFTDLKTYLSPAVSTTVKGVHTAGLLHLYTDYINSHIVTESKKADNKLNTNNQLNNRKCP